MSSSAQQVRNEAQLNEKEKAAVGKAIQEAKSFLTNNNSNVAGQHQLAHVAGAMNNRQQRGIMLYDSHNFRGKFVVEPPKTMGTNDYGMFLHKGVVSHGLLPVVVGSKAGVKYGHFDKLPSPIGYVLAWDNPDDASAPKKVYVIAGKLKEILAMEWSIIEQNLNASGSESLCPPFAVAKIEDIGNKLAVLGAIFSDPENYNQP